MHSTKYIIGFIALLTVVVALVLSLMATGLKPIHERNEAIYNKKAILSAVENYLDMESSDLSDDEVVQIFEEQMTQVVLDMEGNTMSGVLAEDIDMAKEKKKAIAEQRLPLYILDSPKGKVYIMSIRGNGLWDEIWGSVAVEEDFSTIVGVAFDHTGETPGLGAEIKDNQAFSDQFPGKKLFDEIGNFTSIIIRKGGAKDPVHEVDAIGGATVTCDGVNEMLKRGLQYYQPYIDKNMT